MHSLKYVQESLSNYMDDDLVSMSIYQRIEQHTFESEEEFIEELEEGEANYLDKILEREISYARSAGDDVRERELSVIYELLF